MQYIRQYQQLKEVFNLRADVITLPPQPDLLIRNIDFVSGASFLRITEGRDDYDDFAENIHFRYPVIVHQGNQKSTKAIIYLHGLNERTWHKHLAGACYLARQSGNAVVLFPLSFHINRGLPEWTDTRKMSGPLEKRKKKFPGLRQATVANLALSERLTEHPERFFISGIQSSMDLIALMKQIRNGEHPLFEKNSDIDFFSYSVGCTLLQSLMICNPDNIFDRSKFVFFAGGSLFCSIHAISRFIMDSVAFETLQKYYLNISGSKKCQCGENNPLLMEHPYGRAFRCILTPSGFRREREQVMKDLSQNLMVIALKNDRVMPVEGTRAAMGDKFYRSGRFRILDFPYEYTHENPFPVLYQKFEELVGHAFTSVFEPAVNFLGGDYKA